VRKMRMMSRLRPLAGFFVVWGAACAELGHPAARDAAPLPSASEAPEASFRAQLGRTWELARLGTREIPAAAWSAPPDPGRHPGPGARPTIRFTGDPPGAISVDSAARFAGGWSFCNGYGAAYLLERQGRLRFRGFQSTLVGCDGPDSLETRFFRALAETVRFELTPSSLSLVAAGGSRLVFVRPDSAAMAP
jgi:heat shock protein HslJ